MTANELANQLKCHIARHGDCIIVSGGREIESAIYFNKTPQERECVELTLKEIKRHV